MTLTNAPVLHQTGRLMNRLCLVLSWILIGLFANTGTAAELPTIDRAVVDLAKVFTSSQVKGLSSKLHELNESNNVQMAVLTIRTTGELPIEEFSLQVAEKWGGGSAKHDSGVLLVFAIDDRASRLEVGYGLEARIPDRRARRYLDAVVHHMRNARYAHAANDVIDSVASQTAEIGFGQPTAADLTRQDVTERKPPEPRGLLLDIFMWPFLPILFCLGHGLGYWWAKPVKSPNHDDDKHIYATMALWLGAPLLIAFLFRGIHWFWLSMASFWVLFAFSGVRAQGIYRAVGAARMAVAAIMAILLPIMVLLNSYIWSAAPESIFHDAFIAVVLMFFMGYGLVYVTMAFTSTYSSNGTSSHYSSSSSSSFGSSSFGSSSFGSSSFGSSSFGSGSFGSSSFDSSSFGSGSSSSSSSSSFDSSKDRNYSGRGGSFGGGGASSRW